LGGLPSQRAASACGIRRETWQTKYGRPLTQQSWIRALDSKFKICSKELTNFRICHKALKIKPDPEIDAVKVRFFEIGFIDPLQMKGIAKKEELNAIAVGSQWIL
jgi:hypothetical protein